MGRLYLHFDPPGYYWCKEPGYDAQIKGDKLLKLIGQPEAGKPISTTSFFNPPGSEWLMPRPLQFTPDWPNDPAGTLSDYVLTQSMWTWASGVTVTEWNPRTRPGTAGATANKWQSILVPSSFTSLDLVDYGALATAAGVTFPSGMGTIATAAATPSGRALGEDDYAPFLQWLNLPAPQDFLVFGWLDFALVLYQGQGYLLHTPDAVGLDWELLGRVQAGTKGIQGGFTSAPAVEQRGHSLTPLPVGYTELYLFSSEDMAHPAPVKVRDFVNRTTRGVPFSTWWIGAAPNQSLNLQVQVVGFTTAEADVTKAEIAFDLTEDYQPTQTQQLNWQALIHSNPDDPSDGQVVVSSGDILSASSFSNQSLECGLRDEAHANWVSDATHHKGYLYLKLIPGNVGNTLENRFYSAPQVRLVEFTFPVLLEERPHNQVILDDTQWSDVEVSSSLREIDGKRGAIRLWLTGLNVFKDAGLHRRDWLPVEVREDVDGDGHAEKLLRVLWITHPNLTRYLAATPNDKDLFQIECQGVLTRTNQTSLFPPIIINTEGSGQIEHTYLVKQSLLRSGNKIDDPDKVQIADDPLSGTDISQMPGTPANDPGENGQTSDASWAMDEEETYRAYMERITTEFSAWVLYETLVGTIYYHPNMRLDILGIGGNRSQYFVSATLYRSSADATAAGKPGQTYKVHGECRTISPRANIIRVSGVGLNGTTFAHVMERDHDSIETLPVPGTPSPNFLGEPKPRTIKPKLAVSAKSASQIAHVLLQTDVERLFQWEIGTSLSPDDILPNPLDVGRMVTLDKLLDGDPADCLIVHVHNHIIASSATGGFQETTFVCEELPVTATAAPNQGAWPGLGTA